MKLRIVLMGMLLALVATQCFSQQAMETAQPEAEQQQAQEPGASQQVELGAAPLRVMVGKSLLINTADRLRRVSVTDPSVADAIVVTPNQVLIHGKAPGEISLLLWDDQERSRTFDLRVDVDATSASEELRRLFPEQNINVSALRNALVLSGHVGNENDAKRAGMVAEAYTKNVINVLTHGPLGAQEVLLEVKFAEVDRTALTQFGVNLFSTGAANTFGAAGTQQFGGFTGSRVGGIPQNSGITSNQVPGNNAIAGAIGNPLTGQPAAFGASDLLNVFLFRSDINLGLILRALQQKNILQILAEPNLIAVNGKEASFLAGGEFPFPVIQGAGALGSVTIQFKEFGVRLRFTPLIMPNGNIHLQVRPEVSALDFSNALTISGFVVPALSTRRAETEFEIQDGQSFVIAGLLDNRLTSVASKIPGLGDLPILGNLFKSKNLQKSRTELMVLVTARRISPTTQPPPLPAMPQKFLPADDVPQTQPGGKK